MTTIARDQIVNELLQEAEPGFFRQQLEEMFLAWVLHHDNPTAEFRNDIVYTYTCLKGLLNKIEFLKNSEK